MATIRFITEAFAPGQTVTMRWAPMWDLPRGGVYVDGAWSFEIDEAKFPGGLTFKFVLAPGRWMAGPDLYLGPQDLPGVHGFTQAQVGFPALDAVVTENGLVAQRFFVRNTDPGHVYDVIVVGSGMGGGVLASKLADEGADVLVLEAGSYLFPTHVGNLPRRLRPGQFDKHIWSLWPDFKVTNYVNAPGSQYGGGQGFNLGGRSIFWGGLIPRQVGYELAAWPTSVREYLLGPGFPAAEAAMNAVPAAGSAFQTATRATLEATLAGFVAEDAGVAVQYSGAGRLSVPAGLFSTADLLLEDRLIADPGPGRARPTVNLNTAIWRVTLDPNDPGRVTGVIGWDLLAQKVRTFQAQQVVLCAGTLESAKIALQSGLVDPNRLIGKGLTDHTIRYRHFTLPPGSPHAGETDTDTAKVILRHPAATAGLHAYDVVVEIGAEFNQGRYVDPENLAEERRLRAGWTLCEVVFMSYSELNEANFLTVAADPAVPVTVAMAASPPSPHDVAESDQLAADLFAALGAQPVLGEEGLYLQPAVLGGVAHEVGTLRMAADGSGVVDADLRFLAYDNLHACDNSVFPTSPAANPSLTTVALALRLAKHLA